jgi:hypothetical protein
MRFVITFFLLLQMPRILLGGENGPIQTSICDVFGDSHQFDGKTVRLKAIIITGFEVFAIKDPQEDCSRIWLTYPGGGPSTLLSIDSKVPVINRPNVALRRDNNFKEFENLISAEMYPRVDGSVCIGCNRYRVTATLTGRIDVAPDNSGFGHLNTYKARLMLASVDDFVFEDMAGNYDPELYSTTPVRFPRGDLTGIIIDEKGNPIEGILITAISTDDSALAWKYNLGNTDDEGRFEISVRPGRYIVAVNRSLIDEMTPDRLQYRSFYFPDVADEQSAQIFEISDRQRIKITIRARSSEDSNQH